MEKNLDRVQRFFKRGDVILCDLGLGEGSEQSGMRPCVVVQNDLGNRFSPTIIVAAITSSTTKANLPTHIEIDETCGLDKPSVILCEQLRTIDKNRIKNYIGRLNVKEKAKLNKALTTSLEIFKKGEELIINQASKVKTREEVLIEMEGLVSKTVIEQFVLKYNMELMKLENLCSQYRLYIDAYYNKSKEIDSIINDEYKATTILKAI